MNRANRDSKYELLRIIVAAMIVLNHIGIHFDHNSTLITNINTYVLSVFRCGGKLGVTVFVMISALFLADSKFSFKRVLRIVFDVVFYAVLCAVFSFVIFRREFSIGSLLHGFSYWYPFAYLIMIIMIPIINKFSKRIIFVFSIIGSLFFLSVFICSIFYRSSIWFHYLSLEYIMGPIWFCFVYIIIVLLKKHIFRLKHPSLWAVSFLVTYVLIFLLKSRFSFDPIRDMYSPLCFFSAFSLFACFASLHEFQSNIINKIAVCTFGTYLFQCNYNFNFIYNVNLFHFDLFFEKYYFVLWCFVSVALTFILVYVFERIKMLLLGRLYK